MLKNPLPNVYYKPQTFRLWNRRPTPLDEPRIMYTWGMSKEEHANTAQKYETIANRARNLWNAQRRRAVEKYGDGNGVLISGIYRSHFPETVKNRLRLLSRWSGDCRTAAEAHRHCARYQRSAPCFPNTTPH